jgi:hypothetical protein
MKTKSYVYLYFTYNFLFQNQLWHEGWPLTLSKGELVLHLGSIDESLVRLQDFFLCIRSSSPTDVKFYACWRKSLNDTIIYRELDTENRKFFVSFINI